MVSPAVALAQQSASYAQWGLYTEVMQHLPRGGIAFTLMPAAYGMKQYAAQGAVFCKSWQAAAAFGERLKNGSAVPMALADLAMTIKGPRVCDYAPAIQVRPTSWTERPDSIKRPMLIVEWVGSNGAVYFTGIPR